MLKKCIIILALVTGSLQAMERESSTHPFILARICLLKKNMRGAFNYFLIVSKSDDELLKQFADTFMNIICIDCGFIKENDLSKKRDDLINNAISMLEFMAPIKKFGEENLFLGDLYYDKWIHCSHKPDKTELFVKAYNYYNAGINAGSALCLLAIGALKCHQYCDENSLGAAKDIRNEITYDAQRFRKEGHFVSEQEFFVQDESWKAVIALLNELIAQKK